MDDFWTGVRWYDRDSWCRDLDETPQAVQRLEEKAEQDEYDRQLAD